MLFWVPVPEIAAALDDLPGATVQVVAFVRAQAGRFTSGQRLQNVIAGNY